MTQPVQFTIGAKVSCTDGVCGHVIRVVVDPVARAVTHLVVEPKDGGSLGRLRPAQPGPGRAGRDPARLHPGGVRPARGGAGD
jgi:hypothetical protein